MLCSQYHFKTLAVYSNVSKVKVLKSLTSNEITGCGVSVPAITENDINEAVEIVAQMGPEPFMDAMAAVPDFNIIIGGRAYDPSPYIAYCVHLASSREGISLKSLARQQLGGFAFMGKIMECGALCSTPKSASAQATVYFDGTFDIKPLSPESQCLPHSVAAHSLYEKSRPDILPGPGGNLDLTHSNYEQLPDGRSVRVTGATFNLSRENGLSYTVKLEAAKVVGYRAILMGGIRDPILIRQIDSFLAHVKEYATQQNKDETETWDLGFHVYGKNGVMDSLEPEDPSNQPREIFLVGEALASNQKLASSIASTARIACVHGPYPEQRGTSGNFAMGVGGKLTVEMGACAEFCIHHLMAIQPGEEHASRIEHKPNSGTLLELQKTSEPLFSWRILNIGNKGDDRVLLHQPNIQPNSSKPLSTINESPLEPQTRKLPHSTLNLASPRTLCDIAPVIRSKDSGPYDITLDVIFSHPEIYALIKHSNLLTRATVATLYHLQEEEIVWCGFYDPALAFKATIPRKRGGKKVPGGGFMEQDIHGSQQYVGLLNLELGKEVMEGIAELRIEARSS
jgi:hypothetical protein